MNNFSLERKQSSKYLGVWIDDKLSWNVHISHVYTKIYQGLGIINKLRHLLNSKEIKSIYYSYIQSHLTYGKINCENANKTELDKINKILY